MKAGWNNTYEPQAMTPPQGNIPAGIQEKPKVEEKPALRELKLFSPDPNFYQESLFDDAKKK